MDMLTFAFHKLLPGGNSTIILSDTGLSPDELPRVAGSLMHPLHLQAEQVGELFSDRALPHLQMMGGEFCVNATRSAALLLAQKGALTPLQNCLAGMITVSGMTPPVHILVADEDEKLFALLQNIAIGSVVLSDDLPDGPKPKTPSAGVPSVFFPAEEKMLYCAARMICGAGSTRLLDIAPGAFLIHMPGISHLLLDANIHSMPANWSMATAKWRKKAGLETAPASGVVWYAQEENTYRIWPAVAVRATRSEHLETACGSASMAIALLYKARHEKGCAPLPGASALLRSDAALTDKKNAPLVVIQPSGETLSVTLQYEPESLTTGERHMPAYAWVSGRVLLVAEGVTHI